MDWESNGGFGRKESWWTGVRERKRIRVRSITIRRRLLIIMDMMSLK